MEDATNSTYKVGRSETFTPPSVSSPGVGTGQTPYIMPRQTGTGNTRGTQNIAGQIVVTDPSTNKKIMTISGSLGYQLFADPKTGVNQIIIGLLPDGSSGMVISKPSVDVLTVFS